MINLDKELDEQFNKILDDISSRPIDKPKKKNTLELEKEYKGRFITHQQIYPYAEYADWHLEGLEELADMREENYYEELGLPNKFRHKKRHHE